MLEKLIQSSIYISASDSQSRIATELLGHVRPCLEIAEKVLYYDKRDENVPAVMHSIRMVRTLSLIIPYNKFEEQPEQYFALAADDCLHDTWETIARDSNNTEWLSQEIYNLGIGGEDYMIEIAKAHANENHDPVPIQIARMLSYGPYRRFRLCISKLKDIYDNSKTSRSFVGEDKAIKRFLKASYYIGWVPKATEEIMNNIYSYLLNIEKLVQLRDITLYNLSNRKRDYAEQIKAARIN